MPQRIQRKRTKGWRMPEGAVYVGRPTKWGNPFAVVPEPNHPSWAGPRFYSVQTPDGELWSPSPSGQPIFGKGAAESAHRHRASELAVELFSMAVDPAASSDDLRDYPLIADMERELRGKDLACWCPLDQPCHADVLLDLANGGA